VCRPPTLEERQLLIRRSLGISNRPRPLVLGIAAGVRPSLQTMNRGGVVPRPPRCLPRISDHTIAIERWRAAGGSWQCAIFGVRGLAIAFQNAPGLYWFAVRNLAIHVPCSLNRWIAAYGQFLDCGPRAPAPWPAPFETSETSSDAGPAVLKSVGKPPHSKLLRQSAVRRFCRKSSIHHGGLSCPIQLLSHVGHGKVIPPVHRYS
jgi:hypothetical protein